MPTRERPCLEHVQRRPGLLVAFSLSLVSFKTGGHKPETKLRTSAAQAMGTFTPAAQVLSWSLYLCSPVEYLIAEETGKCRVVDTGWWEMR